MTLRITVIFLLFAFAMIPTVAQERDTVVVVTHDSFAASETALAAFEDFTGLTLEILRAGDAGFMVNQAILSKNNPLGDALYGIDNTFLSRALDAGIFAPYESYQLEYIADGFLLTTATLSRQLTMAMSVSIMISLTLKLTILNCRRA